MRTTLDIDDGVLAVIKELAQRQGKSAGAVLSALARQALMQGNVPPVNVIQEAPATYGFRPLPAGKEPATNALVDRLREEQGV